MATKASHSQNCGKAFGDAEPKTFYGNVICSEQCQKELGERVYFRDDPPEPGSIWYCPHCGSENPLADPKVNLRPNCTSCDKPLDPDSAAPPKKGGCLVLLVPLVVAGAAAAF